MEIILLLLSFIFLYMIISLAINNSKLSTLIKQNNEISRDNNRLLKEMRNLMKENMENKSADKKTLGHIIDEKL